MPDNINRLRRHNDLTQEQAFAMNNNQLPPQVVDLEESVLGALMIDDDALVNTIDKLQENLFYKPENKEVFSAILQLYQEGSGVDILTVTQKLKERGTFDGVGGSYKLISLTERVASAAHIESYVRVLAQKAIQRELIRVSTQTLRDAYKETIDPIELLDKTESDVLKINEGLVGSQEKSTAMLADIAIKEIVEAQKADSKFIGLPSGFDELDNITGGFQPGTLIILAARPAMGKTAFALNIARNMAMDFKHSVAVFSLEMTASELMMRLISSEVGIEGQKLKRADQISTKDLERIKEKAYSLGNCKMYIDDNPGLNIMELKAKCKRMKMAYNIDMIFIDYLQLMSGGDNRNTNREQEISYISRQLKSLAKELNIPVFALSQLSREVEKRGGSKEPMLSDLRESGAIEQDADIVMFIYRPHYYGIDQDDYGDTTNVAYINVEKNRAGKTDKARIGFEPRFVKFYNLNSTDYSLHGNALFDDNSNNTVIFESKANNIDNSLSDNKTDNPINNSEDDSMPPSFNDVPF